MKYTRFVPAAVLAVLVTACDTSELVNPEAASPTPNLSAARQGQILTQDDEHARVARAEVPGFAGFYLKEDGTPVVRLVNVSQRGAAQRYLAQEFVRARRGRHANAPTEPVFLSAAYDFAQLKGWAGQVEGLLTRSDVYLVDVDEVNNRVHVGVADNAAAGAVRSEAARMGIPAAALFVQTQPKPEGRATLRDRFTTLPAGTQIAFGAYVCTLGFNARQVSTGANIYVTNSHCTRRQYASDGIALYQPTRVTGNEIGVEISDRALYACVSGVSKCRHADAAYYSNNGTRTPNQGGIARTALATFANAGITIIGEFDIVARYTGTLPVGTMLEKTGRTSGSTYGQVTQSCVTIGSLRCQDVSRVWSEGGDSGSPMYVNVGGNSVALQGILWGGPSTDWTTTYSSRLTGIEQDLGALTNLCRPGYGC